jgi:outer membrane biosynthesis protein TonB
MKSPAIIHKFAPFVLLFVVLVAVLATNLEAEASSMPVDVDGFNTSSQISPLPTFTPTRTPLPPTATPTRQPTAAPTDVPVSPTPPSPRPIALTFEGPSAVELNEIFRVNGVAQNVPDPGLYGVQFEINYDADKVAISNLEVNSSLFFVVRDEVDNTTGRIVFAASRQGRVPGLTGNVIVLSFDVTAIEPGVVTFAFEDAKFSSSQAEPFSIAPEIHNVTIEQSNVTPVPTQEPTPKPTVEPTPKPTVEPTPKPTVEPTPKPTVGPTPQPTQQPTPQPTQQPTPQPAMASVSGRITLIGRFGNNWSGATARVGTSDQTTLTEAALTDVQGNFNIENVSTGLQTVTADAPGYLSAVCSNANVIAPQTVLNPAALLAGDINGDDLIDIVDAATVGTNFGQIGTNAADITQDDAVDIFDIVLVSVNYGEIGPQDWNCVGSVAAPIQ